MRRRLACPPDAIAARVAGALLIRRSVFDRVGPFDPSLHLGETIDWIARADSARISMRMVDTVVLRRRIGTMPNTGVQQAHRRADYLRVIKAALDRRRAGAPASEEGEHSS